MNLLSGKVVVYKHVVSNEASSCFVPQGVVIDDLSGGDRVEHVLEIITTLSIFSNGPTLLKSSFFSLMGEKNERRSKISTLKDKRQQEEKNVAIVKSA